jgi:histidinol-phosphate aminotransferase
VVEAGTPGIAPAASQVYTWEPSDRAIAARYGLRADEILRFDTNTSPLPPPFIGAVLGQPFEPSLNEYPDSSYQDLTEAASAYVGVPTERIVVGAGADEIIDLVAKAWLWPGSRALIPPPTYAMYAVLSSQRGAEIERIPRRSAEYGFALDLDTLLSRLASAAVVWLCAPNNPTGAPEDPSSLMLVLEAAAHLEDPPLVVIDEAYAEFVDVSAVSWLDRYPRLLVVRTMSKAFAMAGVRVGYAAGSREVIARLERVRPPGSISTISATLAAAALRRPELARDNVERLATEREWLAGRLAEAGWHPVPSVTNFLLVAIAADAAAAGEHLLRAGIVPRTFGRDHPLAGHLRLTVRTRPENERLLSAIASVRR